MVCSTQETSGGSRSRRTSSLVLVLVGPTAAGKTELSIDLAETFGFEIVGADSRQVYQRLDIGTAKPGPSERSRVVHHLVDFVLPTEDYQAFRYQQDFRRVLAHLEQRGRTPLVVGGTGLYLRAGIEGLSPGIPSAPVIREALRQELARKGPEVLHRRLAKLDSKAADGLSPRDKVRIVRMLEICLATGMSATAYLEAHPPEPIESRVEYLGLDWSRRKLYDRIDRRADQLLKGGWIEEVEELMKLGLNPESRAMQSLGYAEIVCYLKGELDRRELLDKIQRRTRRYAKRQLTWFRALPVTWLDGGHGDLVERARVWVRARQEEAGLP